MLRAREWRCSRGTGSGLSACAARAAARRRRSGRRASARGRGRCGLIVRRRASQASRSAVSGLSGPAPSSSGGASSLTCTISVVGLRLMPPSAPPPLPGERDERIGGRLLPLEHAAGLLVDRALVLGDAPDRLLEGGALLERQAAAEAELASAARPGHAERAALGRALRRPRPRAGRSCARPGRCRWAACRPRCARARASVSGVANSAAAATWSSVSAPVLERVVERGQAAQRAARACDVHCGAVVAARDLREPLRARRAPRRLPVAVVVGFAHDLRDALLDARFLRAERAQLAPARLAAPLPRPGRPSHPVWRTSVRIVPRTRRRNVPRLCRKRTRPTTAPSGRCWTYRRRQPSWRSPCRST